MKALIPVKLRPFKTPNYVSVIDESKVNVTRQFHISEVSEDTLIELCDAFKTEVLAKAKQKEITK